MSGRPLPPAGTAIRIHGATWANPDVGEAVGSMFGSGESRTMREWAVDEVAAMLLIMPDLCCMDDGPTRIRRLDFAPRRAPDGRGHIRIEKGTIAAVTQWCEEVAPPIQTPPPKVRRNEAPEEQRPKITHVQRQHAAAVRARMEEPGVLPRVRRIAYRPMLVRDAADPTGWRWRLPGYDAPTLTYTFWGETIGGERDTRDLSAWGAARVDDVIANIIGTFDFQNAASRSNALGALVALVVEDDHDTGMTPIMCTTGPDSGAGKTYLPRLISYIARGESGDGGLMPLSNENKNEVEFKLGSLFMEKHEVYILDNADKFEDSDTLNAATTAGKEGFKTRVVGTSGAVWATLEHSQLWLTGLDIRPHAGAARRMARIGMVVRDRTGEDPEGQKPMAYAEAHRADIIFALMWLVEKWRQSGAKPTGHAPMSSYASWSHVIGGIIGQRPEGADFMRAQDEAPNPYAQPGDLTPRERDIAQLIGAWPLDILPGQNLGWTHAYPPPYRWLFAAEVLALLGTLPALDQLGLQASDAPGKAGTWLKREADLARNYGSYTFEAQFNTNKKTSMYRIKQGPMPHSSV